MKKIHYKKNFTSRPYSKLDKPIAWTAFMDTMDFLLRKINIEHHQFF